MSKVYVIGTCDTKGDEMRFACDCVSEPGAMPFLVDVSTAVPDRKGDGMVEAIASHYPKGEAAVLGHTDRGQAVSATPEENAQIGSFVVERLNRMAGSVRFLPPLKDVSTIDAQGRYFHDPAADAALFEAIGGGWKWAKHRRLVELDRHINDPAFAEAAVAAFESIS